jgi:hypothetical protein
LWCGKAIRILPEDSAEDIKQETIKILKDSRQPESKLTGAEQRVLRSLKANGLLIVLPAQKGNASVVLGTSNYNRRLLLS